MPRTKSIKERRIYYVANPYVGCGHRHKSEKTVRKCYDALRRRGGKNMQMYVWYVDAGTQKVLKPKN